MATLVRWTAALSVTMLVSCGQAPSIRNRSVYSDLEGSNCTLLKENRETGAATHRCGGTGGWDLLVLYDDQRMSITVVPPDGSSHPLDLWEIAGASSSLGPRAEWRIPEGGRSRDPVALVVRVNASEQQDGRPARTTSYLVVAKLQRASMCVTELVAPASDANERARKAADASATASCVKQ